MARLHLQERHDEIQEALFAYVDDGGKLAVIQAPPGSGKTALLVEAVVHALSRGERVAVGAQTNAQADDICRRLVARHNSLRPFRFCSSQYVPPPLPPQVQVIRASADVPAGSVVLVGTTKKWAFAELVEQFDVLFVDEAWQMAWSTFMPLGRVAGRFVLIGDPGQIPPVVGVETQRWETASRPPHWPAPEVILRDPEIPANRLDLPSTRRLPDSSVSAVRAFYEFQFESWAEHEDRRILLDRAGQGRVDAALDVLHEHSMVGVTLPTPDLGPPLEQDEELADLAIAVASRVLERGATVELRDDTRLAGAMLLAPEHIGLTATHRVMNMCLETRLPNRLRGYVRVDTPERWQGLERHLMIVVHPLSGVVRPSAFDLETGRLCVMASRHRISLVVVARDHVGDTLAAFIPAAEQPVGLPDIVGRGRQQHLRFWQSLESDNRIIAC